jgi:hypothetical protein
LFSTFPRVKASNFGTAFILFLKVNFLRRLSPNNLNDNFFLLSFGLW